MYETGCPKGETQGRLSCHSEPMLNGVALVRDGWYTVPGMVRRMNGALLCSESNTRVDRGQTMPQSLISI